MNTFKKIYSFVFAKIKRLINGESTQTKRVRVWTADNGERLRYEYPLNENSFIMDVGGYEGDWASNIFSRYCSTIYIFEPVTAFAEAIKKRFHANNNIKVFAYGLSNKNTETEISLDENSSSTFKKSARTEKITLQKVSDFFNTYNIKNVDLMKLNIEGDEYGLLEDLIETGLISRIKNIQVQFHDFVPNAETRMRDIQKKLTKTHHTTYQYLFVWENWERNQ